MIIALQQHALSAAFPAMSPQELSDLTDDIAAHGLRQPVITYKGQVLDGWHRYQACLHAEVKPALVEFDGADPVAFVLSLNMSRRHLSASQRAAAVVACSAWKPAGRPEKGEAASPFLTNAKMAKAADTTTRTIQKAKRAHEAGLGEQVRDGKVSVERAAEVAKLPKEDWQEALERKSTPKEVEVLEEVSDNAQRMADLVGDFEAAVRIIESDDKVAEAWAEVKTLSTKLEEMTRLYDAKCRELATMTSEAKRWMKKAQAKEVA